MSGLAPFFLTGANAKIRLNGKTLAFCTNVSYSVDIPHAAPTLLGNYEPASLEPLAYKVQGQFAVIRYVRDVARILKETGYKVPSGVAEDGNGTGNWGPDNIFSRNGIFSSDGQAHKAMNPADLDSAVRFDFEIYQKLPGGDQCAVARLRDCRITKSSLSLQKKTAAIEVYNFIAIYADEDSFLADMSGQGQQFG